MRSLPSPFALLLLAACGSGSESTNTPTPPPPPFAIVGGAAECDACTKFAFQVTGAGLSRVVAGTFLGPSGQPLPVQVDFRLEAGAKDTVLQGLTGIITDTVGVGEYDLKLVLALPGGGGSTATIAKALRVTTRTGRVPPAPSPPTPTGSLSVSLVASGPRAPGSLLIEWGRVGCFEQYDCGGGLVSFGTTVQASVDAGDTWVGVYDLAEPYFPAGCRVTSPNPVVANVPENGTASVTFNVYCE